MGKNKENEDIYISKEFGFRLDSLLNLLKERGIKVSKEKIAEALTIEPGQISRYIKGINTIPISKFFKLTQFLSLTPNDIAFLFTPLERAIGVEKSFQNWLYLNGIPYLVIDPVVRSEFFKGMQITPDYILLFKDYGTIAVDVKYRNSLSDSIPIKWPLNGYKEFEKITGMPLWFVFSNFTDELKTWYWVPLSKIKDRNKINIPEDTIVVEDRNSLLNGLYNFKRLSTSILSFPDNPELEKIITTVKEIYDFKDDDLILGVNNCVNSMQAILKKRQKQRRDKGSPRKTRLDGTNNK